MFWCRIKFMGVPLLAPEVELALWFSGEKATEIAASGLWKLGKGSVNLFRGMPDAGGTSGRLSAWLRGDGVDAAATMYPEFVVPNNIDSVVVRRAYLNEKFGRSGDINYDITLRGYLERVDSLGVSSRPGEAVFYSGWNPAGVSNRDLGEAFARQKGWTTLEQTPGGKWLDQEKLYGSAKQGDFLNPADADKVWAKLSQRYAEGVEDSATAFVNGAKPDRVFYQYEYPILLEKGIKINFMD